MNNNLKGNYIMKKLTKAEVIKQCREVFKSDPITFRNDDIAKREYFNIYTDNLRTDGLITEHQYLTWTNPF